MIQHNKFANDCNHIHRAWLMKHWLFTLNKIKFGTAEKLAVNMLGEIQPKKIRLAENWAAFFKSQPDFAKKFGWEVYATISFLSYHSR